MKLCKKKIDYKNYYYINSKYNNKKMFVQKRNGKLEEVYFDKITARIKKQAVGLTVNVIKVTQQVSAQLINGIKTSQLDRLTCQICMSLSLNNPDYIKLASNIFVSNLQKSTPNTFSDAMELLYNNIDIIKNSSPLISEELYKISMLYKTELNNMINNNNDYLLNYFGLKTLERAYLMKTNYINEKNKLSSKVVETPQYMFMRVAIGIHGLDISRVEETYTLLSNQYFIHATPTLFNAGTPRPQMSSCYLLYNSSDSVHGIYKTITDCAKISKFAGGIGVAIHNVRAKGSYIRGTNGISNGIMPMLKVFDSTSRYIDQCFHPTTLLFTEGGMKKIVDIKLGEKVITHDNSFKPVTKLLRHEYSGDVCTINDIMVTPEHPFYAIKYETNMKFVIENNLAKPTYIQAKDLTETHLIIYPLPNYINNQNRWGVDDCFMYGILLRHVYIQNKKCSLPSKKKYMEFVLQYFMKLSVQYSNLNEDYIIFELDNLPISYKYLYNSNKEKRIPTELLSLPLVNTKAIIDGYTFVTKKLTFTSSILARQFRYLLLRFGKLTIADQYNEELKIDKKTEVFIHNNTLYVPIKKFRKKKYSGILCDLEIDTNHNYLTEVGLVHNGGGRRNGSFAMYLEPWHADIIDFLEARRNQGAEEERARNLFYGLWIPDLFMKRVEQNAKWTLMCPDRCKGLMNVYGEEFEKLYESYEHKNMGVKTVNARDIWNEIINSQIETGMPYMAYKDAANRKTNQKNVGVIKSSNLCVEIMEYTDDKETAVCNLASIGLPKFVTYTNIPYKTIKVYSISDCNYCKLAKGLLTELNYNFIEINCDDPQKRNEFKQTYNTFPQIMWDDVCIGGYTELLQEVRPTFDFYKLMNISRVITRNLNRIIDKNFYPLPETKTSNFRHRPIGIGVQGLADVFLLMKYPFESKEARELNKKIFETIYYGSLVESHQLAIENGPYSTFKGSPLSKGKFQFDLWNDSFKTTGLYNWNTLRQNIMRDGVRNSLLIALMPTASTSQIMGNNESMEAYTSNMYVRRTLAGEFIVINKHLIKHLISMGIWNELMKKKLMYYKGSVKYIPEIPAFTKELFKTSWEMKQKGLLDLSIDRAHYVCQSQSLNIFIENPTYTRLTKIHFYGWKNGLKTGSYYIRSKAASHFQRFTIDPKLEEQFKQEKLKELKEQEKKVCLTCSA